MRTGTLLLLAAGLALAGCGDGEGPSPDGTLIITTATGGGDPDADGYQLAVDDRAPIALAATGSTELGLASGRHRLLLSGVAAHCSVAQGTSLEVEVPPGGTATAAFEVSCPGSAVEITVSTTGLDLAGGYQVRVDGVSRGDVVANGTVLTRVAPGTREISLTGLPANCAADGPASQTVTLEDEEVVPVEFAIVCTAATGVIEVRLQGSGLSLIGGFEAAVDGGAAFEVHPSAPQFVSGVAGGEHVVSLTHRPPSCSVDAETREVTVTTGGLTRDTAQVEFAVACTLPDEGLVRVTAPTTGSIASTTRFSVWYLSFGYWDYGGGSFASMGELEPNGTLAVELPASGTSGGGVYWYNFELRDVPESCTVASPFPPDPLGFTVPPGGTLNVQFQITCPP